MDTNELLRQISIPEECPVDWEAMQGNDRQRFCPSCGKHVYNISAMTPNEAIELIRERNGSLCGRITRLADGSIASLGSPRESLPPPRHWQFRLRSIMAVIAGCGAALGITRLLWGDQPSPPPPAPTALNSQTMGGSIAVPTRVMQSINNAPGCRAQ